MVLARFIADLTRRWRKPRSFEPIAPHIALGLAGERAAAAYLRKNGYKILYRNFRAPHGGEVDLVCRDKRHSALVFIEVKTRTSEDFGRPFDAVDHEKRSLIMRGALKWLKMLDMPDVTFRFDVVEVLNGPQPTIHIIENAFQLPDSYSY